jgi:hypothetical protein
MATSHHDARWDDADSLDDLLAPGRDLGLDLPAPRPAERPATAPVVVPDDARRLLADMPAYGS